MAQKFANNASAILADPIANDATVITLTLQVGTGVNFPTIIAPDWCIASIEATDGTWEITKVIAHVAATDVLIVDRAFEGSTLTSFASGSRVELRMTKFTAESFFQTAGGTFTGTVDFDDNEARNVRITNSGGKQSYAEDLVLRSANTVSTNEIQFPSSGAKAQMGGSNLVTEAVLVADGYTQTGITEVVTAAWNFNAVTNFNSRIDLKAVDATAQEMLYIQNSAGVTKWRFRYMPHLGGADADALDIYTNLGGGTVMRLRGDGTIKIYGDVEITGSLTTNGAISTTGGKDITADGDIISNGN